MLKKSLLKPQFSKDFSALHLNKKGQGRFSQEVPADEGVVVCRN
ncbi:hypothetical protein [Desulfonatronospira sp.]|nr:hypothetical protein [Desulfonatronospira sp.]